MVVCEHHENYDGEQRVQAPSLLTCCQFLGYVDRKTGIRTSFYRRESVDSVLVDLHCMDYPNGIS